MENVFNDLLKEFFDSVSALQNLNGFDIKTEKTPNGLTITAVQKPVKKDNTKLLEYIKDFNNYVNQSDDFVFESACGKFAEVSDIKLEQLQAIVDTAENEDAVYKYTSLFKNCIKQAASEFISELKEKYEL